MPLSFPDTDKAWNDALLRASGRLSEGDELAHLYYEERADLRIGFEVDGAIEVVPSAQRGMCVRTGGAPPRSVFLGAPALEDADRLVSTALGEGAGPRPGKPRSRPPESQAWIAAALAAVQGLCRHAQRRLSRNEVAIRASWVAFRQRVHVARPGRGVRDDLRQGARVRLDLRAAGVGATGERALRFPGHDADLRPLADDVTERLRERRDVAHAKAGPTAVIFAPGTGGILIHEVVGHGLEADTVLRRGSSFAAGATSGTEEVTVVDDPRRGRAAWRWDDEGVESRAVSLVERGRVVTYLSDLTTAGRAGIVASGHGRRSSYRERVLPRMGCTFLAPGRCAPEEIVRETSRGVLVRRMEAATVDPLAGRALFRVTDADAIERGRPRSPLYPFLLEVDLDTGLSSLDRVGDDLEFDRCIGSCLRDGQPLSTSVGAPTCRLGVATVVL